MTKRSLLLLHYNPNPAAFSHDVCDAVATIYESTTAGITTYINLFDLPFNETMTSDRRKHYSNPAFSTAYLADSRLDLRSHTDFFVVYPVWWYGLPGILKNYVDLYFLPWIHFDDDDNSPLLQNILTFGGSCMFAMTENEASVVGDLGKSLFLDGLVPTCFGNVPTTWLPMYSASNPSAARKSAFLSHCSKVLQSSWQK